MERHEASTSRGESVRPGLALGLIGAGHFMSHFWQITLPSLFTVLAVVFHVDFFQLGLIITVATITSAVCQLPVGYLVDRYGPKPVLGIGLVVMSASYLLSAFAPSYLVLLALGVVAGAGQSVFHPADYATLTALFPRERAGRAYSIHTFTGFAGSAVAPLVLAGIVHLFNWQVALGTTGVLGLIIAAAILLALRVPRLGVETPEQAVAVRAAAPQPPARQGLAARLGSFDYILSRPLLLIFAFFVFTSMFTTGLQSYLPSTLSKLYDAPTATANGMLTTFLAVLSAGILIGGIVADKIHGYTRLIAAAFAAGTLLMFLIAVAHLPIVLLFLLFGLSGGLQGVIMPSRDKMVREAGPESSSGTSFAFVTLGMNLGSIIALPILGAILDQGKPDLVFWMLAIFLLIAVVTVLLPSHVGTRERSTERVSAS